MNFIAKQSSYLLAFLANSNIFIALCALALSVQTLILSGIQISFHPYWITLFCATLLVYNYNGAYLFKENIPSKIRGKFGRVLLGVLLVGCIVGGVISAFYLSLKTLLLMVPLGILSLAYYVPLLKKENIKKSLKQLVGLKVFLIAFVWAVATVIIPHIELSTEPLNAQVGWLFMERLLFIFALAMPFDIRDMQSDSTWDVRTYPVVFGVEKTKRIAVIIMSLHLLTVMISPFAYSPQLIFGYIIIGLASITVIEQASPQRSLFFFTYANDGMMFWQSVLVFILL